ncbi:ParA family protein [Clostridium uliginosum]|uniref:Chromosome partitioning protein n=1 Tax=Clostridium uliginosum TaxID=119641 RepID=A0A1I1JL76_9CLOT|nr:AAA family ATPase [Clostridium uliginosum]SFC49359.1 chromosome partitioning protein [Clostridium uliginosum]
MAKVISFINLKGGVGKTTLLVATAEVLADEHNKKVLVIDLDPQTNATVLLISQERWKRANENNRTIHQLFLDKVEGTTAFNINKSIIRGVSNIGNGVKNLDLLPSSIDLIDIYDKVSGLNENNNSIKILKEQIEMLYSQYDYILVDCPPNLGAITMCGIYMSQYYIIPVIADTLSTYGLNQVVRKINEKAREIKRIDDNYLIKSLGVVINRFRNNKPYTTIRESLEIRSNNGEIPRLFETVIYNRSIISNVCDYSESKTTIRGKYGQEFNTINNLVKEIVERC